MSASTAVSTVAYAVIITTASSERSASIRGSSSRPLALPSLRSKKAISNELRSSSESAASSVAAART